MAKIEIDMIVKVSYELDRSDFEEDATDEKCAEFEREWAENEVIEFLNYAARKKGIISVKAQAKVRE